MNYKQKLELAGVPVEYHDEAIRYLEACEDTYHRENVAFYKLTAWLAVGWLLLTGKVKYEDEKLPDRWWKYDNEVSMNGDRGTWLLDEEGYAVIQPCPLDDSALQYSYFPPSHPRSKTHRWKWLGTRNMASKFAESLGPLIPAQERSLLRSWGNRETDRKTPGVVVHEWKGHWCIYEVKRLALGFIIRRNVGVKLAMAVGNMRRQAPLVNIQFSVVRAK